MSTSTFGAFGDAGFIGLGPLIEQLSPDHEGACAGQCLSPSPDAVAPSLVVRTVLATMERLRPGSLVVPGTIILERGDRSMPVERERELERLRVPGRTVGIAHALAHTLGAAFNRMDAAVMKAKECYGIAATNGELRDIRDVPESFWRTDAVAFFIKDVEIVIPRKSIWAKMMKVEIDVQADIRLAALTLFQGSTDETDNIVKMEAKPQSDAAALIADSEGLITGFSEQSELYYLDRPNNRETYRFAKIQPQPFMNLQPAGHPLVHALGMLDPQDHFSAIAIEGVDHDGRWGRPNLGGSADTVAAINEAWKEHKDIRIQLRLCTLAVESRVHDGGLEIDDPGLSAVGVAGFFSGGHVTKIPSAIPSAANSGAGSDEQAGVGVGSPWAHLAAVAPYVPPAMSLTDKSTIREVLLWLCVLGLITTPEKFMVLEATGTMHNFDDGRKLLALVLCATIDDIRKWTAEPDTIPEPILLTSAYTIAERRHDRTPDFNRILLKNVMDKADDAGAYERRRFTEVDTAYCIAEDVEQYLNRRQVNYDTNKYEEQVRKCLMDGAKSIRPNKPGIDVDLRWGETVKGAD